MTITKTRRLLAAFTLAAVAALPGCRESLGFTPPEPGQVLFTYTGHVSGTFSANGVLPRDPIWSNSYAAAYRDLEIRGNAPRQEYFVAVANSPQSEVGITDFFWLILERPAVGTYTCDPQDPATCRFGALMLPNLDTRTTESEGFYLASGTLEVLTMTGARATGEFEMVLEDPTSESKEPITIAGTFDVPIVPTHYIVR